MIVYIVQMEKSKTADCHSVDYRDVDEPHRYVAGVFTNYKQAHKAGETEVKWRHGKYNYHIHDCVLDHINKSKIKYEICEENAYGELAPAYKIIDVRNKLNK
jgi:hypothetical protein